MFHLRGFLFCAFFHLVARRELPFTDVVPTKPSVLSSNGVLSVYGPYSSNSQFYLCNFSVGETTSVCFVVCPTSFARSVSQNCFVGFSVRAGGFAPNDLYSSKWKENSGSISPFDEAFRIMVCEGCRLDFSTGVARLDCKTLSLSAIEVNAGNLNSGDDNSKVQSPVIHIFGTSPFLKSTPSESPTQEHITTIAVMLSSAALLFPLARLLIPIYLNFKIWINQSVSPSEKQKQDDPSAENPPRTESDSPSTNQKQDDPLAENTPSAPKDKLDSQNLINDGTNKEKKRRRRKKKGSCKNENLSSPSPLSPAQAQSVTPNEQCGKKSVSPSPTLPKPDLLVPTVSLPSPMFSIATTLPCFVPTPIIAPHARAPGKKIKMRSADEDLFKYDIWGDHLFALSLSCRSSKTGEWESFFVKDPQMFTQRGNI